MPIVKSIFYTEVIGAKTTDCCVQWVTKFKYPSAPGYSVGLRLSTTAAVFSPYLHFSRCCLMAFLVKCLLCLKVGFAMLFLRS